MLLIDSSRAAPGSISEQYRLLIDSSRAAPGSISEQYRLLIDSSPAAPGSISEQHRLLPCCPWQHLAQSSTHRLAPALSHRLHFRARGTQGTNPTQEFIDSSTRRLWSQNGAPMRRFAVIDSP